MSDKWAEKLAREFHESYVVHVTPVDDLVAHDETGGALCDCVCGPDVEFVGGGGIVVTHHSLDGRELHEADTEKAT